MPTFGHNSCVGHETDHQVVNNTVEHASNVRTNKNAKLPRGTALLPDRKQYQIVTAGQASRQAIQTIRLSDSAHCCGTY